MDAKRTEKKEKIWKQGIAQRMRERGLGKQNIMESSNKFVKWIQEKYYHCKI